MSHFSVLVVTPTEPTEEMLGELLQPFHEFECTGKDDQYIVDVDVTEYYRKQYQEGQRTRLRLENGEVVCPWEDQFYRDPTTEEVAAHGPMFGMGFGGGISYTSKDWGDGRGYRAKVRFTPDGAEEIEVPYSELMTFAEYCEEDGKPITQSPDVSGDHKYGYTLVNDAGEVVKVIDRTNPNSKWDWWMVGGRYSGKFAPEYDPETDPNHKETCWLCRGTGKRADVECENGCNGCKGTGIATTWPTQWTDTPGNQIRVGDIPWNALRQARVKDQLDTYNKAVAATQGMDMPPKWDDLRDSVGIEAAREIYNTHPTVVALRAAGIFDVDEVVEDLKLPRDDIAARAASRPLSCWAILKDGQWYQSGEMGWWGMSSNDKDPDEWTRELNKLIESLPADSWLTCVDCHI